MRTITHYTKVSDTNVISYKKKATVLEQKHMVQRYAKSYALAYGEFPSENSIRSILYEYDGVPLQQAISWINKLKSV